MPCRCILYWRQSNPKQRVTLDGESPSRFTRKRCEIGCPIDLVNDAERGCAAPPPQGNVCLLLNDQALGRLIKEAARGKADPSESES